MRLDAYIRVSQVAGREGDSFISPTVQREAIERWAKFKKAELVNVYEELDQSGSRDDRPMFNEALERAESGQTDGIIVAKLSRFSRSLLGAMEAIRRLDQAGAKFVSVEEQFDTTTSAGKLMLRILFSFHEFELDRIRESHMVAKEKAVRRGVYLGSTPPGYRRATRVDPKRGVLKAKGPLLPDPKVAPVITEMFQRRADGAELRDLCAFLEEHGVVSNRGSTSWTRLAVARLLRTRAYLGEASFKEIVNPDAHEPLVDRMTWEAVQGQQRQVRPPAPRTGESSVLAGLVRCQGCLHTMSAGRHRDGRYRGEWVFSCRRYYGSGECPAPTSVHESRVLPIAASVAMSYAARDIVRQLRDPDAANQALTDAEVELERIQRGKQAFITAMRAAGVGAADMAADLAAIVAEEKAALEAVAEKRAATRRPPIPISEGWAALSLEDQRRYLRATLDCVIVRKHPSRRYAPMDDRVLVFKRGDAPADLPASGSFSGPIRSHPWPPRLVTLPGGVITRDPPSEAMLAVSRARAGQPAGNGSPLRALRHERGLTQRRLAELAGVDPATVRNAETDAHRPRRANAAALAAALGVEPDSIA